MRLPIFPAVATMLAAVSLPLIPATVAHATGTVSLQPAAGPPGTVVTLHGEGLPARRSVVVRVGKKVVTRVRSDAAGAFAARVRLTRAATITTRFGRRVRAINTFAVAPATGTGEVAAADGTRIWWTPLNARTGTPVRVNGAGFRPRRPVAVTLAGRTLAVVRASRAGRFRAQIAAREGRGFVRQGSRRLPFALRTVGPDAPSGSPASGTSPTNVPGATPGRPTTSPPAGPGELGFPIRAAFYYPWFPEAWKQGSTYPYTHFSPSLGWYDSGDTGTIARHLDQLQYAHVQAAISSWWGQGHYTDRRLPTLLQTTRTVGSPVRWAVYYEPEGWGDPSVAQLASDLSYLRDRYASDPAYMRLGGRFVVFAYGDAGDSCSTADRWRQANAGIGAYVVLKVVAGHRACAAQPDSWHQYAPANRTDSQVGEAFAISPGFWLASESAPRLARDITCFRRAVRDMVASKAPWQLVTTFDEWGEGTSVEPAQQWATPSGYGAYLDALRDNGAGTAAAAPC